PGLPGPALAGALGRPGPRDPAAPPGAEGAGPGGARRRAGVPRRADRLDRGLTPTHRRSAPASGRAGPRRPAWPPAAAAARRRTGVTAAPPVLRGRAQSRRLALRT